MKTRLAIVTSHPIQYYAPWFRQLALAGKVELKVFYLWDFGVRAQTDPGFGHAVEWDVPLLDGYPYVFVPNTSRQPGTGNFLGLRNPELLALLQAFAPDAALLLCYRYASTLRLIIQRHSARPYPLLFRGDSHRLTARPEPGWQSWLRERVISWIYGRFRALLYVGQANYAYLRQHGVPAERLFFAPHTVDNARFGTDQARLRTESRAWRRSLDIPPENTLILFAGKLEEKKRPLDLLAAFRQLQLPRVSLLFVGAGQQENALREQARGVPQVYFAPFQNQAAMPLTYAAGDLFVLPSYGPAETWGLAVNEAMCLGLPVVVSTHVGCAADLVRPGENGLIFPAGDVAALTAALREALGDRPRLARWGEASRAIIARYSYAEASRGLLAALAFLGL